VATSAVTAWEAIRLGLEVVEFTGSSAPTRLDITIDGADQVAPSGWLVKGGGGAHTRERAVAAATNRFVAIVSSDKLVDRLSPPIPLELAQFGLAATLLRLGPVRVRNAPLSPDGGVIADYLGEFDDPEALGAWLSAATGVIEHGLFPASMVAQVLVGRGDHVEPMTPAKVTTHASPPAARSSDRAYLCPSQTSTEGPRQPRSASRDRPSGCLISSP